MKARKRLIRARARIRGVVQRTLGGACLAVAGRALRLGRTYHPLGGKRGRNPEPRWEIIRAELQRIRPGSILDVGCAEGWYLRAAAEEFGCSALGVDGMRERVQAGEVHRLRSGVERVAIMEARLTPEAIRTLPTCDVTLCLSMLYHVIGQEGLEGGTAFLAALADVTRRALILEPGPPRLPGFRADGGTGKPLPPEAQDPHWRAMLAEAGWDEVEEIGRTVTYGHERAVYRAVARARV